MTKLTLWLTALAAFLGSALQAQDISGSWQGTLQAGQQKIRIVFKIALENDKLRATLYTADRPAPPFATTITREGSSVKITIPGINGTYEGKLSGEGNSIAGTWTQGAALALNLARATPQRAACLAALKLAKSDCRAQPELSRSDDGVAPATAGLVPLAINFPRAFPGDRQPTRRLTFLSRLTASLTASERPRKYPQARPDHRGPEGYLRCRPPEADRA
jgi:hypothetical protein